MPDILSPAGRMALRAGCKAICIASIIEARRTTTEIHAVEMAMGNIEGCVEQLFKMLGPRETAELLYRFADSFVGTDEMPKPDKV